MNKNKPTLLNRMLRTKPIEDMSTEGEESSGGLQRSISLFQLTMIGVGATIGSGIFVILGDVIPKAGPGVVLSFVLAGITAALTALCYAELASTIPASGSSYSFTYATMGEMVAYLVGWCLLLEYGIACSATSVGWGQYLNELLVDVFGMRIPNALANPPGVEGGVFNLPAVILVFMCCMLLIRGTRESAQVNALMVLVKIAVLIMFILIGVTAFNSSNLSPFMPMGMAGVGAAASSIFFSYIGLDTIATAGEEVKNPKRNLPLAIIFSLLIVTTIYVLVAFVGVTSEPYTEFDGNNAGLVYILRKVTGVTWPGIILSLGAIISIFSVTLVTLFGQTRILYTMSRDGMLPKIFSKVDARSKTPRKNTILVCTLVATAAAFVPLNVLADLTSMGTLVAFGIVSVGVIVLRRTRPDLPRGFKVPFYPVLPICSVLSCLYLIYGLSIDTYILFAVWLTIAFVFYFAFSIRNSALE